MKLTLVRRQLQTHDTESFYFRPETPISYTAGQYLHWHLPHEPADDRGIDRYFTISSAPNEPEIALTTKFSDPGSSFKRALKALAVGQTIEAGELEGDFILPPDPDQAVVFVAGGVGITPLRSMLKWITSHNLPTPVHLIHGCRSDQDELFAAELAEWSATRPNLKVTYVLGSAPEGWQGERGKLSGDTILRLTGDLSGRPVYLSGPEPMVKSFKQQLIDSGISPKQIKMDDFPGYTDV